MEALKGSIFAIGLVANTHSNKHTRGWGNVVTWVILKGNIWSGAFKHGLYS